MRLILFVALLGGMSPTSSLATDHYRPTAFFTYMAPDYIYFSEVYTQNSCDIAYFKEISIYSSEADLRDDLAWPCPPTENLFEEGEELASATQNAAEPAARASRPFPGLLLKIKPDGVHNFNLPEGSRAGWRAVAPAGPEFIKFNYDGRLRYAKVFGIRRHGRTNLAHLAIETEVVPNAEETVVKECSQACNGKHYVLSGKYDKAHPKSLVIFLAVDRAGENEQ